MSKVSKKRCVKLIDVDGFFNIYLSLLLLHSVNTLRTSNKLFIYFCNCSSFELVVFATLYIPSILEIELE